MYKLAYSKRFEKQIRKIPSQSQIQIVEAIANCKGNPRKNSIKLITTYPSTYRLRVGEYRIFFQLDDDLKLMIVTDVVRRTSQTYH